jgi:hypothetical protein
MAAKGTHCSGASRQVREGFGIDPHLFQTRGGEARRQPGIILAAFCRFKVHVFRGDQLLIQININVIFTRGLAIALSKCERSATALGSSDKSGVKIVIRQRG